jgi:hypothetical protein
MDSEKELIRNAFQAELKRQLKDEKSSLRRMITRILKERIAKCAAHDIAYRLREKAKERLFIQEETTHGVEADLSQMLKDDDTWINNLCEDIEKGGDQ